VLSLLSPSSSYGANSLHCAGGGGGSVLLAIFEGAVDIKGVSLAKLALLSIEHIY